MGPPRGPQLINCCSQSTYGNYTPGIYITPPPPPSSPPLVSSPTYTDPPPTRTPYQHNIPIPTTCLPTYLILPRQYYLLFYTYPTTSPSTQPAAPKYILHPPITPTYIFQYISFYPTYIHYFLYILF